MDKYYYLGPEGRQMGPYSFSELRSRITPETIVWREGMDDWAPASTVPVRAVRPSFIRFYPFHDDRGRSGLPADPDAADWACLARLLSFASLLRAFVPPRVILQSDEPCRIRQTALHGCMSRFSDDKPAPIQHACTGPAVFQRDPLFFSLNLRFQIR